jgi:hypothetical protein
MFHDGMTWQNYGNARTGGIWQTDHFFPLGLILEGTPQAIIDRVLSLPNLRPLLNSDNAQKAGQDRERILKFRELLEQGQTSEQLWAFLEGSINC